MTALSAADYLVDFGADGEIAPNRSRPPDGVSAAESSAGRIAEAYTSGFEKGKAAAHAAFEINLRARRAEFEEELNAARSAWAAEIGKTLAEQLTLGLREGEQRIAEAAARILKPFLASELHRQAMADLNECLDALIAKAPGLALEISAPPDVLEELRQQMADKVAAVTYQISDDCNVRVTAGATILETHFASWMAKIEKATR